MFGAPSASSARRTAEELYRAIVVQARQPIFYTAGGVADTPDGRFDMILLHAALVIRRLGRETTGSERLAQALFDYMFADLDQNLREMGVGDLAVGKRIKAMARGFYGRLAAYDQAIRASDASALGEALRRNLYRKATPSPAQLAAMATYVLREVAALQAQPLNALAAGTLRFGLPPGGGAVGEGADGR